MRILEGEIGGEILLSSFAEEKSFLINSPGGSLIQGLAMYDFVSNSDIEIGIIGMAASAATLPLIASKKRWGTENSRYLIHNPWTIALGTANELANTAIELKEEELKAIALYEKHLSISKDEIIELMKSEKMIHAEEALKIGLITEIRNINNQTNSEMEKEEVKNEIAGFKTMLAKMKKIFVPKFLVVQDVNGIELDFGDSIETIEQVEVGTSVSISDDSTGGSFVLNDGQTIVVENGQVTEIIVATEEESAEVEALKAENENLKAELESLKMEATKKTETIENFKTQFETLNTKFEEFKNKFSEDKQEPVTPTTENTETKKRVSFNLNKKQ